MLSARQKAVEPFGGWQATTSSPSSSRFPRGGPKHEQRARQSKSKSRPCLSHSTPQQHSDPAIPQSSILHLAPCLRDSLLRNSESQEILSSTRALQYQTTNYRLSSPLPSPPAIHRALFAFHMPLTKVGSSSGRNSPAHAGKSSHFRHPFGGRVSKHFGDMVSTLATPRCDSHTVRPS